MTAQRPILIVGEHWGDAEEQSGKAFDGASGFVLNGILRQVGIDRRECAFTNVFNFQPQGGKLEGVLGPKSEAMPGYRALTQHKYVRAEFAPHIDALWAEVERVNPNIIVALGNTPLWALTKKTGLKRYRGAPMSTWTAGAKPARKLLATWSPASILRQWELRVVALADFAKARREAASPEIRRPERFIYLQPTLEDIEEVYHTHLRDSPFLSGDIETKARQITEIGFSEATGTHCLVIPFASRENPSGNYWPSLGEELAAWRWVRFLCTEHELIGQNFSYDMQYLLRTVGIPCPRFGGDTMLLHHSLHPELEKGLGFLGSIYTDEPSWKFMRTDHATLKQADD